MLVFRGVYIFWGGPAPQSRATVASYLEDHPMTFKWLGSPPFISHLGHLEGEQPYLG